MNEIREYSEKDLKITIKSKHAKSYKYHRVYGDSVTKIISKVLFNDNKYKFKVEWNNMPHQTSFVTYEYLKIHHQEIIRKYPKTFKDQ
jgi:CDP-diacylglycerol pyrophosphatase